MRSSALSSIESLCANVMARSQFSFASSAALWIFATMACPASSTGDSFSGVSAPFSLIGTDSTIPPECHDPLHQPCLLEKDSHVHLAVHCRRGGQILLGLLWLAAAAIELAQA